VTLGYPAVTAERLDFHARFGCGGDEGSCAKGACPCHDVGTFLRRLFLENLLKAQDGVDGWV